MQVNADATGFAVTPDGRFIVFGSTASTLLPQPVHDVQLVSRPMAPRSTSRRGDPISVSFRTLEATDTRDNAARPGLCRRHIGQW